MKITATKSVTSAGWGRSAPRQATAQPMEARMLMWATVGPRLESAVEPIQGWMASARMLPRATATPVRVEDIPRPIM